MNATVERTRKLSVEFEVPVEFLTDVLTTAVEGGIAYWCRAKAIQRNDDLGVVRVVKPRPVGVEDDGRAWADIDLDVVHTGLHRLLTGSVQVNHRIKGYLLRAMSDLLNPDPQVRKYAAGSIDADAADCIVQAGLFAEIVYG